MDFILENYAKDNPDKLKFHRAVEREAMKATRSWANVLHGLGLRKFLGRFTNMDVIDKLGAKAKQQEEQQEMRQLEREQLQEPKPIVQRKPPTPKPTRQSRARRM